jgi:hypothetical protein
VQTPFNSTCTVKHNEHWAGSVSTMQWLYVIYQYIAILCSVIQLIKEFSAGHIKRDMN